jgi:Zn-dependent peptidase ImmA (M78 family)
MKRSVNRFTIAVNKAQEMLDRFSQQPPVDVELVARALGVEVRYQSLDEGTSGFMIRPSQGKPTIGVNSDHHPNRQKFTIAHEIGHFVLHASVPTVLVDESIVHFRDDKSSTATDPREREANAFAAQLLMPESAVRQELNGRPIDAFDENAVRGLAVRFGVSTQAITLRLKNLNLVAD